MTDQHDTTTGLQHIATLCGNCSCGCPTISLDTSAAADQQVVIEDDFNGTVRMSREQFAVLVQLAQEGKLAL